MQCEQGASPRSATRLHCGLADGALRFEVKPDYRAGPSVYDIIIARLDFRATLALVCAPMRLTRNATGSSAYPSVLYKSVQRASVPALFASPCTIGAARRGQRRSERLLGTSPGRCWGRIQASRGHDHRQSHPLLQEEHLARLCDRTPRRPDRVGQEGAPPSHCLPGRNLSLINVASDAAGVGGMVVPLMEPGAQNRYGDNSQTAQASPR